MFLPRGHVHIVVIATLLGLASCGPQSKRSRAHADAAVNANPEVQKVTAADGNTLIYDKTVEDAGLFTVVYEHRYQGVKVLGSEVRYHANDKTSSVAPALARIRLSPRPRLSYAQAITLAKGISGVMIEDMGDPIYLPGNSKSAERLIYQVRLVNGDELWIDANTGEHMATLSGVDSIAQTPLSSPGLTPAVPDVSQVRTAKKNTVVMVHLKPNQNGDNACAVLDQGAGQYHTLGVQACQAKSVSACQILDRAENPTAFNPAACSMATKSDASAARAKENAQRFVDFLKGAFSRNSYDGQGAAIVSIVHAGRHYANAGWFKRERYIAYGDGDGLTMRDFTYAQDIAGHELTHALISSTAGLISFGETGALNESIADYFGSLVEGKNNWAIGEELFIDRAGNQAIRDIADPARLKGVYFGAAGAQEAPYPAARTEEQFGTGTCVANNDYCGVHFNATIPGHAWFLIHQRLGQAKTLRLLYYALTHFFDQTTDFQNAARKVERACELLDYGAADCGQVSDVFKLTGMR